MVTLSLFLFTGDLWSASFSSKVLLHNPWHLGTSECEVGWQPALELLMAEAEVDCFPKGYWGAAYQEGEAKWAVCLTQPSVRLLLWSSLVLSFREMADPGRAQGFMLCCILLAFRLLPNGISHPVETPLGDLKLVLTDWRGPEVYCFPIGPPSSSVGHNPYGIRGPSC